MSDPRSILLLIEENDPALTDLALVSTGGLGWRDLDAEANGNWERVGIAVGNNTSLREIAFDFSWYYAFDEGSNVVDFWRGLANNRSIDTLRIGVYVDSPLPEEVPPLMASLIENNPNLSTVRISWNQPNFEVLASAISRSSLKDIKLLGIGFNPKLFSDLFKLLGGLPQLEKLQIWNINIEDSDVEDSSWIADIACLLNNDKSNLIELSLGFYGQDIDKKLLASVSKGLEGNNSLKDLCLALNECGLEDWDSFERTIQLYNDSIERVEIEFSSPPREIQSLLAINSWDDKESIRFRKGLDYDFLKAESYFNGKPFGEDFEITLMPYILSSIGITRSDRDQRSEIFRHSALFHCIRNLPKLVLQKYDSKKASASRSGRLFRKRKHLSGGIYR